MAQDNYSERVNFFIKLFLKKLSFDKGKSFLKQFSEKGFALALDEFIGVFFKHVSYLNEYWDIVGEEMKGKGDLPLELYVISLETKVYLKISLENTGIKEAYCKKFPLIN